MLRITHPTKLCVKTNVKSVYHGQYAYTINLVDRRDTHLGRCCLKPIRPGVFETHSSLRPMCCGKGFGVRMYSRAIFLAKRKGYRVCSSHVGEMSDEAYRLWSSSRLRRKHRIYRRGDRFWVA